MDGWVGWCCVVLCVVAGKGGENIKTLQQRTGCNIQVTRDADMPVGSNMRPVNLIGSKEQVEAAQTEIKTLLAVTKQPINLSSSSALFVATINPPIVVCFVFVVVVCRRTLIKWVLLCLRVVVVVVAAAVAVGQSPQS